MRLHLFTVTLIAVVSFALGACRDALPTVPDIPLPDVTVPELPVEIPGIPESLQEIPNLLEDLGLPDLSQFTDIPQLDDLPLLNAPAGAQAFRGPTERRLDVGQRIPGTDIELVAVRDEEAEFRIAGLRSIRVAGDSLDFDGDWAGLSGVSYSLRLRIYRVNESSVRVAGVQQLLVRDVEPTLGTINPDAETLSFPYTVSAGVDQRLPGLTYGYAGQDDSGARIIGLPGDEYPYRKLGDSIRWRGFLRGDIPVEYNLRVLYYSEDGLRVGGAAHIALPGL